MSTRQAGDPGVSQIWLLIEEWMDAQLIRVNQSQFADAIGVERQAVSQWKRGQALPRPANLRRISEVTRIPMARLLMALLVDLGYLDSASLLSAQDRARAAALAEDLQAAADTARRGRPARLSLEPFGDDVGVDEGEGHPNG